MTTTIKIATPTGFASGTINDRAIYPGWDQNNDFISDFNQNDNATVGNITPDYEEPFLRYNVDRPEFLFGIDLNNNNWIDRFEDDDLPDFPINLIVGDSISLVGAPATGGSADCRSHRRRVADNRRDHATNYGDVHL